MREGQVGPAALQIEAHPQILQRDRGALDVPARPARAERGVPGRFAGPPGPPQQRVEGVLLALAVRVATALGDHRLHLRRDQVAYRAEYDDGAARDVYVTDHIVGGAITP